MTREEYQVYLHSEHWADVKQRFRESKRPKTCIVCNYPKIELHHISYDKLGEERIDKDIIPLCRKCHQKIHNFHNSEKINVKFFVPALHKVFKINRKEAKIKLRMYHKIWSYYKYLERCSRDVQSIHQICQNKENITLSPPFIERIMNILGHPTREQFKMMGITPKSGWRKKLIGKIWTREFLINLLKYRKDKINSISKCFTGLGKIIS